MSKHSDFVDSLKDPDAFISSTHSVLVWVERHARTVAAVIGLGSFIGLAYVGYTYWNGQTESKAAERLYKGESELHKAESKIREERAKKMQDLAGLSSKSKGEKKPEQIRPVDYAKDYAPIVNQIKVDLKATADTRAAMVSALNLSYFLVQQKQFQEALEVLNIPSLKPGSGDLLGGFWRMHKGVVLIENQKADEALALFNQVLADPNLKPFHPEAMLKSGIALEIKGDGTKAKEIYEKLGREHPNSEASSSAAQFLRLLELKSKQG